LTASGVGFDPRLETIPPELSDAVLAAVEAAASIPGPITPSTCLAAVGVTGLVAKTLAAPFEDIARRFNSTATISRTQCENLGTVSEAICLVGRAAGLAP
jgi:hypothetical protein